MFGQAYDENELNWWREGVLPTYYSAFSIHSTKPNYILQNYTINTKVSRQSHKVLASMHNTPLYSTLLMSIAAPQVLNVGAGKKEGNLTLISSWLKQERSGLFSSTYITVLARLGWIRPSCNTQGTLLIPQSVLHTQGTLLISQSVLQHTRHTTYTTVRPAIHKAHYLYHSPSCNTQGTLLIPQFVLQHIRHTTYTTFHIDNPSE